MLKSVGLKVMLPIPEAIRGQFTLLRARRGETQTDGMCLMLLAKGALHQAKAETRQTGMANRAPVTDAALVR